jgi:hypothetical protein
MTYLIYVAMFGTAAVFFLWLRDARIFFRTGLPLYRKAAYWGVLYGAAAVIGLAITSALLELLGLGVILGVIYLQVERKREKVWKDEDALTRLLGCVPVRMTNKK